MLAARAPSARLQGSALRDLLRRSGASGFMAWWRQELAAAMPGTARTALKRRRLRPVLAVDANEATLWMPATRDGAIEMRAVERLDLTGDAAAVEAAGRAMLARVPPGPAGNRRVTVAINPRQVLRRQLVLPAALEENLRQALAYDLDRHTPFRSEDLYFDAEVVGRDAAAGTLRVDLAAARRGVVDQAIQRAEAFGATVAAVSPEPPPREGESRLSLVPEERRLERRAGRAGWTFWVPMALLLAAAALATALPIWQKREYALALQQQVEEARIRAGVSERLRGELDRLTADYNFALERKFAYPPTLAVLEEVTRLLPDDTWLTQMELKTTQRGREAAQRELLLRGESANAGRLITAFEESKVFAQAAPRSPTTKIQPGPGEIFDLAAQLRVLPMPMAVAVAQLPPLPEAPTPAAAAAAGDGTRPPATGKPAAPAAANAPGAATQERARAAVAPPPQADGMPTAFGPMPVGDASQQADMAEGDPPTQPPPGMPSGGRREGPGSPPPSAKGRP